MKKIPLTKYRYALVDDEYYKFLMQWKWYTSDHGYAVRNETIIDAHGVKRQTRIQMHRVINNTPIGFETDHIDGDRLDNRKSNLRSVTDLQNSHNKGNAKGSSSKYKGVCWHKKDGKWQAAITYRGIRKHLGSFDSEEAAAKKYNKAALEHHGKFARLNEVA